MIPPQPLDEADRDAAVALWVEAGLTRPWNDPVADFTRAVAGAGSAVLGVRDPLGSDPDGRLIGTVMVGTDGHRGWVYYLAVARDRRGRGTGAALMRAAEAWLAVRDCPKLMLMVRGDNVAVRAFYTGIGYGAEDVTVLSRRLT